MVKFRCPVCGDLLSDDGKTFRCSSNHCYDKSKFGYVNLLLSNQSSLKHHGDDRLMIRSRRDFLSKGYYSFLLREMCSICREFLPEDADVLDAGCGECYYSGGIKNEFMTFELAGVDISKDALEFACKRVVGFPLAVASLFNLPFENETFDCIINCFSPKAEEEFYRVLKKGGKLIRVVPLEKHLFSLKAFIYDKPYLNDKPVFDTESLNLLEYREIKSDIILDNNEDIQNLFRMTPYYYKTGREDQQKLFTLDKFETTAEFGIFVSEKV